MGLAPVRPPRAELVCFLAMCSKLPSPGFVATKTAARVAATAGHFQAAICLQLGALRACRPPWSQFADRGICPAPGKEGLE